MKSPFPGMDPFLELHWGDVHTSLMVYARNQINAQLPADLQARVEESRKVTIDADNGDEDEESRTIYPDVRVVEDPHPAATSGGQTAVAELAKPLLIRVDEYPTTRHIEIVDLGDGHRVVTAIEVLSPVNKVGHDGITAYQRKQHEYVMARVNLVEIDLLRQGEFVLAAPIEQVPQSYRKGYMICIRRGVDPLQIELYGAPLDQPLPNIPIPLRPTDEDVVLKLQPLIDDCYRDGRYDRIDYRKPLRPPLTDAETAWVARLVEQRAAT